jgi:hypothetical protein
VAELLFNKFIIFTVICFYQIELFLSVCYKNYIQLNKFLGEKKNLNIDLCAFNHNTNITLVFSSLVIILNKGFINLPLLLLLVLIFCILLLNYVLTKLSYTKVIRTNFYNIILPNMIFFLATLSYVDSFLTLFFFIELYGVFYYFSFLTTYSLTNQTLLKYKNGLLFLLWNNFLTTVFMSLSIFTLSSKFGTTNFVELFYLSNYAWSIYLFFIGLCWKLGLPVLHFFKVEVYKYLLRENVFLFSVVTTIFNLTILYFFLFQNIVFSVFYTNNIIIIPVLFTIVLVIVNLKIYNILYYLALSSMLTITTIFCLFLI